jgi:hypothetical protein
MAVSIRQRISRLLTLMAWPFFRCRPRGWPRHVIAAALAAAVVALVAVQFDLFGQTLKTAPIDDNHAKLSLRHALALTICGTYGVIDHKDGGWLPAADTTYRQAVVDHFGSHDAYCRGMTPYLNNENALFWVMAGLLALPPNDTAQTLAAKMVAFRCGLLFAVLYLLGLVGVGVVPLLAIGFVAGRGLEVVQQTHMLSVYPTLGLLLLAASALLAVATVGLGRRRWLTVLAGGIAFGLAWGFIYNFRTSYGMIVAIQLVAAVTAYAAWNRPFRLAKCCGLLLGAAAALLAVQAGVRHLHPDIGYNYAHHPIWHPIVLGLANPGSALSRREGLRFDDELGETLARRIDPTVSSLGPGYEKALREYYLKLWSDHSDEMLDIYISKIEYLYGVLNRHIETFFEWLPPRELVWESIVTGWTWLAVLIVGFVAVSGAYPLNAPLSVFGRTLAAALIGVTMEQAFVIGGTFVPSHQTALVVGAGVLSAILVAILGALLLRLRPRKDEAAASSPGQALS